MQRSFTVAAPSLPPAAWVVVVGVVAAALATVVVSTTGDARRREVFAGTSLPRGDRLLERVERRFGPPDRVTGTGRMTIEYDVDGGGTLRWIVSGDEVLSTEYVRAR